MLNHRIVAAIFAPIFFSSTYAFAESYLARIRCDAEELNVVVDQAGVNKNGIQITGSKLKFTQSDMPTLAISGRQALDEYIYRNVGIRQSGTVQWIWSPDQDKQLVEDVKAARKAESEIGLGKKIGFEAGLIKLPEWEKANENYKKKEEAIASMATAYEQSLEKFTSTHSCSDVSFTIERGEPFELVCGTMSITPAEIRDVISKDLRESASTLNKGAMAALRVQFTAKANVGQYSSCDNFQAAR